MNREDSLARLTVLYLDQTMGKERWGQPNYERVMDIFSRSPDGDVVNMVNYLQGHVLPLGTSLRELFHKASRWRAFDYYKEQDRVPLKQVSPYSIEMLLRS